MTRLRSVVVLPMALALLAAVTVPEQPEGSSAGATAQLARGKELFLEGNYVEAVSTLRQAARGLERSQDRLDARLTLALIHQAQAQEERTLMELQWALVEDPDLELDPELYSPKMRSLLVRAREGAFERFLSAKRDFAAGKLDAALEEFLLSCELLMQNDGEANLESVLDGHLSAALILQTLGDAAGAREAFRRALALRPGLELDTDFYSPTTVSLFREVREAGPTLLARARDALSEAGPESALEILGADEAAELLYAPAQKLEARVISAYARFRLGDRERATEELTAVIEEEPAVGLDARFYDDSFRNLAENLRIVSMRGLPTIAVVQSSDSIVHDRSREGFEDVTLARYHRIVLPRDAAVLKDASSGRSFDLVYALGEEALALAEECCASLPLIAGNLPATATVAKDGRPRGGVLWNVSLSSQVPVALRALPAVRRIGALVGPDQGERLAADLAAGLEPYGVSLSTRKVESDRDVEEALAELLEEVDLFWYLPDPVLASVDVFETVRERCVRERVPIFAFHESLVREGAFLGVSADFRSLGRQAGRMAVSYLSSRDPAALGVVPADASRVVINLAAASRMGLEPDPNLVSLAANVFR